jgi:3D (Asp-Asp-Asp) domain-containing protein
MTHGEALSLCVITAFLILLYGLLFTRVIGQERQTFEATAYCKGHTTASGKSVQRGMVAADPEVFAFGQRLRITGTGRHPRWGSWDGEYVVEDTGPLIKGRILDLYFWSCFEALAFGRRDVTVEVL